MNKRDLREKMLAVVILWLVLLFALTTLSCGRRSLPASDEIGALNLVHEASSQTHQWAVGTWISSTSTVHLFNDHTGALDTRKCEWIEIDEFSLKTTCEAAIRDDLVLVFVMKEDGEDLVGIFERYADNPFRKIRKSPS